MSAYIDRIKNDQNLPITYSINIQTSSTPKRPLTCYITTTPRTSNYFKPSIYLEKSKDNKSRSSIHLPVTYSTSIHVPCHPPMIKQRSPIILPSPLSHHHYHHHHYYYYHHHHRQSSRPSTTIKHKMSPRPTSIASTRPATTSTTTITSPDSSSSPSKKPTKNMSASFSSNKQSSHPPPLPSYSTLVWNWFHHTPTNTSSHRKGSQSDYSETYRHELPSKRSLLFKLLTSPIEKPSKSKHHRPCFTRKRLESSSSLPNKSNHYNE